MNLEPDSTRTAAHPYGWAGRFLPAFLSAPPVLRAFAVFSLIVIAADSAIENFGSKHLGEVIVPFAGWAPDMPYMFSLFFAFSLMFSRNRIQRYVIDLLLLLQIIYGLWQLSRIHGENFHNPYLTVSPWQPIWTVLIPLSWIVLLHSPPMNRFLQPSRLAQA